MYFCLQSVFVSLGQRQFTTLIACNAGPFQNRSQDKYGIKYRFSILLSGVEFSDGTNDSVLVTIRLSKPEVSAISFSGVPAVTKQQIDNDIKHFILIRGLNGQLVGNERATVSLDGH